MFSRIKLEDREVENGGKGDPGKITEEEQTGWFGDLEKHNGVKKNCHPKENNFYKRLKRRSQAKEKVRPQDVENQLDSKNR